VVYSDDSCQNPIVKKSQLDGAIKLDLKKCNPTSGIFFAPGSFYKADCVVSFLSLSSASIFPSTFSLHLAFFAATFSPCGRHPTFICNIPHAVTSGPRSEPGGMGRNYLHHLLRHFRLYRLHVNQGIPRYATWYCAKDCFRLIAVSPSHFTPRPLPWGLPPCAFIPAYIPTLRRGQIENSYCYSAQQMQLFYS
jgi:hypothetical protein